MPSNLLARANEVVKSLEGYSNLGKINKVIKTAQAMCFDAIPLEQIKGDLARAGHPVHRALALDPDGRRLFFTDRAGEHLYAVFSGADTGHRLLHVGHQASIVKEFDVTDLKESGSMIVETEHDEEDFTEEPGIYPGGTPTIKPEEDDRGFSAKSSNLAARAALLRETVYR